MNKPLKTILISALATVSAFSAITYTSCNRDKCKTIVCANGGVCNDGACNCPSGYGGPTCETTSRDKFLGEWQVFEKGSNTNASQYSVSVAPANIVTDVVISKFYNYFVANIRGTIVGDTIYIPNQQLEGKVVFGKGYIYTDVTYGQYGNISLSYEVIDTATNVPDDFGYYAPDGSAPSQWNK